VAMTTSQVEQVGAANNAKPLSWARAWRSRRVHGRDRDRVAIIIPEMAANIIHHVRHLLVAHHAAERGHVPLAPDHDPQHVVGGAEIAAPGEGRIGAGADGALRVS